MVISLGKKLHLLHVHFDRSCFGRLLSVLIASYNNYNLRFRIVSRNALYLGSGIDRIFFFTDDNDLTRRIIADRIVI